MSGKKIAAVFAGQGAQRPGMGQDFFESFPEAKAVFDRAADATGTDIAGICFADEDPRLNLTEFTQPCILTMETAVMAVLGKVYGFAPATFGGHSLGEYSALCAAGAIDFADAVRIVRKRGQLMQKAVPEGVGAMAAIIHSRLEELPIADIAQRHGAEPANVNSPEQIVLSGKAEAVKAAGADIEKLELGGSAPEVIFLEVSAPFHCSLMRAIEPEFRQTLEEASERFVLSKAAAVVSNFTGAFHKPDDMISNLVHQISGSVRWVENMRLLGSGADSIIEIGPNRPLQRFFAAVGFEVQSILNVRSMKKIFGEVS